MRKHSTKIHMLRNDPGKRGYPKTDEEHKDFEVVPDPVEYLEPPDHLNEYACEEWRRITAELNALGMLTSIDLATLVGYCTSYATVQECNEELGLKCGLVHEGMDPKTGEATFKQYPWVTIRNRSLEIMHKYVLQLGLSPIARKGFKPGKPEDPDEDFFENEQTG